MLNLLLLVTLGALAIGLFVLHHYHRLDWAFHCAMAFALFFIAIAIIWPTVYMGEWHNQRDVEQFVESQAYQSFLTYLNTTSDGAIVELEPMSDHIRAIYDDINRHNKVIAIHTAANRTWWLDWNYPDWDAPEIIRLK